ncbi:MAG: hypothetical protein ABIO70_11710 [Pseudomonadota bacterium]
MLNARSLLIIVLLLPACSRSGPKPGSVRVASSSAEEAAPAVPHVATAADDAGCAPLPPTPVTGPDCLSGTLSCGQRIRTTTAGGSQVFDGGRYLKSYCFPTVAEAGRGPERVYRFELAAGQRATLTLDSPCGELALVALRWEPEEACPGPEEAISECEGASAYGGAEVRLEENRDAAHYLVIVDGAAGDGLPFTLTAACEGP